MKKPALLVLGVLLVALISIYFIVPQNITTTCKVHVDATDVLTSKFLVVKTQWKKWWPDRQTATDSTFTYGGATFVLQKSTNSNMQVLIALGDMELTSEVSYAAADEGSTIVTWITQKQSSLNPFTRVAEFVKIRSAGKDIEVILSHFKQFMQADTNVYGYKMKVIRITDSITVVKNLVIDTYPSTETIYGMLADLRRQIQAQNAKETNLPMLHVEKAAPNEYNVMTAIPINKVIKTGPNTTLKGLVVNGNVLSTDVKGGPVSIANAHRQIKDYQKDHRLISPAIPYEILLNNRLTEKDTAKWLTKVCSPIF